LTPLRHNFNSVAMVFGRALYGMFINLKRQTYKLLFTSYSQRGCSRFFSIFAVFSGSAILHESKGPAEIRPSDVVVKEQLIGMRPQPKGVVLFAFGRHPHLQEISGKNVAFEQKLVVLLQQVQGLAQTPGHLRHPG